MVVVSLFVNPSQFGQGEDFDALPARSRARDAALGRPGRASTSCSRPPCEEVYPAGFSTTVEVAGLSETLCGAPGSRGAGHFRGVDDGGREAAQHVPAGRRLLRRKGLPADAGDQAPRARPRHPGAGSRSARPCATPDGLALSSRNAYLSDLERRRALVAQARTRRAERAIRDGARARATSPRRRAAELEAAGVEPEYVEVVSARRSRVRSTTIGDEDVLIAIAARVGGARLIDNVVVELTPCASALPSDRD